MVNTQALLRVIRSGWAIVILLTVSLLLCWFAGRHAFTVWWLAFSGMVLVGISVSLGNLPYRLLQPGHAISKWSKILSWVVWAAGVLLLVVSPVYANTLLSIILGPAGVLSGVLFCIWVSRKEPFKWTR